MIKNLLKTPTKILLMMIFLSITGIVAIYLKKFGISERTAYGISQCIVLLVLIYILDKIAIKKYGYDRFHRFFIYGLTITVIIILLLIIFVY